MNPTVTVDVDDRGRFTIPEPARIVLSIRGAPDEVRLTIRVLDPDDAEGNETTAVEDVDDRGRVTIAADTRRDLGIYGTEAILEIDVERAGGSGS